MQELRRDEPCPLLAKVNSLIGIIVVLVDAGGNVGFVLRNGKHPFVIVVGARLGSLFGGACIVGGICIVIIVIVGHNG
jgi:hypothetical protein